MPVRFPKPLSDYDSDNVINEGDYEVHIIEARPDVINDKTVLKVKIVVDGVPSYGATENKKFIGWDFEHVYWLQDKSMFIIKQLCDAIGVSAAELQKIDFDEDNLLNKPFIGHITTYKSYNQLAANQYQKSLHDITTKAVETGDEKEEKDDLPF